MSRFEDLHKLLNTAAELDPELAAYRSEDGPLGFPMVRHPLVYSVPHVDQMNAMLNEQLKAKKEAVAEARRKRDWHKFVYLHERPHRIKAFLKIQGGMGDAKYWELLGDIWTDTENAHQNQGLWIICLTAKRPYRSHLMSAEERAVLKNLAPEFMVYRGYTEPGTAQGFSWTTNRVVAKFFARRFAGPEAPQFVASGTVRKRNAIAFFDDRSEYEVLVLPEHVEGLRIERVTA